MRSSLVASAKPGSLFVAPPFMGMYDNRFPGIDGKHDEPLKPAPVSHFTCDGVRNVIALSATPAETAANIRERIAITCDRYTADQHLNLEIAISDAVYDATLKLEAGAAQVAVVEPDDEAILDDAELFACDPFALEAAASRHDTEFTELTTPAQPEPRNAGLDAAGIQAYFARLRGPDTVMVPAPAKPVRDRSPYNWLGQPKMGEVLDFAKKFLASGMTADEILDAFRATMRPTCEVVQLTRELEIEAKRLAKHREREARTAQFKTDNTAGAMRRVEAAPKPKKDKGDPSRRNNQGK